MGRPILLLLVAAGCTLSRAAVAPPPPTVVRTTLTESVRTLVAARLAGDGWRGEVLDLSRAGQSADNPDEAWDETSFRVRFAATGPDGGERLLAQPEMAALLRGLRADVRKLVTNAGGENQDTTEGELFRERWLLVPYKLGPTAGWVRVTVGPASGRHEETHSRLELGVRELPARP